MPQSKNERSDDSRAFWMLTADRKSARLLLGSETSQGRFQLREQRRIDEHWDPLQHGRPSSRSGKQGHSYASEGHEDDERIHRFAKQTAAWLEEQLALPSASRLHVFAAPRFLGELRKVLSSSTQGRLIEHRLDLAHLSDSELAKHTRVIEARSIETELGAPEGA